MHEDTTHNVEGFLECRSSLPSMTIDDWLLQWVPKSIQFLDLDDCKYIHNAFTEASSNLVLFYLCIVSSPSMPPATFIEEHVAATLYKRRYQFSDSNLMLLTHYNCARVLAVALAVREHTDATSIERLFEHAVRMRANAAANVLAAHVRERHCERYLHTFTFKDASHVTVGRIERYTHSRDLSVDDALDVETVCKNLECVTTTSHDITPLAPVSSVLASLAQASSEAELARASLALA